MGIMSLLEKQRKDPFKFQLHASSYREENPLSNWALEAFMLSSRDKVDDIDSELDYAMDDGRYGEINEITTQSRGKPLRHTNRELN